MTGRTLTAQEFVAENPVGLPLVSREGQMHIRGCVKACYLADGMLVIEVTGVRTAGFGPPFYKPFRWKRDAGFSYRAPEGQTVYRERKGKYRIYIMYIGGIVIGSSNTRELAYEVALIGLLLLYPLMLPWWLWCRVRTWFKGVSR
jgi:hypothetical protein